MAETFKLDPQLAADTLDVGDLPLSRVLLRDDMRFAWLILVPRRVAATDWFDLAEGEAEQLLAEARQARDALAGVRRPDRFNYASLGNIVSQLHLHVVARFTGDDAWPGPVFGCAGAQSYPSRVARPLLARLRQSLSLAERSVSEDPDRQRFGPNS